MSMIEKTIYALVLAGVGLFLLKDHGVAGLFIVTAVMVMGFTINMMMGKSGSKAMR